MIYSNDRAIIFLIVGLSYNNMTLRDVKINFLVGTATELFMDRSIPEVTIKDIAVAAQVGEATIYRYFGNKQNIVVHAAMRLQTIVSGDFFKLENGKTGYEKLAIFYESYLEIFKKHPKFYKFLEEFDSYISENSSDVMNPYESAIDQYKEVFMQAYALGVEDGSIKKQKDIEMFYFSTTHALLELCKKLALRNAVLSQDERIAKDIEIKCLIDIILGSLNNL